MAKLRRFTPEEDQYLRDHYLEQSLNQLADSLGRAMGSVAGRVRLLGLVVPEEVKQLRFEQSYKRLAESGKAHRYPKGHIPANKGKKMDAETYEKCKATMFKPGQLPHNTKHFGKPYLHTRKKKNGYVEKLWFIQEGTNKRSAYLAYLCRQHGIDLTGKKPRLKPGFDHSRPPTIDDIIIVSNRKNMKLNSLHRYPPEVVKLVQLKGAIQRQINKQKENEQ